MAMNTFANFPKSTPTTALEVIMDVMPIHLHCQQEAMSSCARLGEVATLNWQGTNNNKTHSVSHLRHWENAFQRHNINVEDSDACTAGIHPCYRANLESFSGHSKHRIHSEMNIYTDGSRLLQQTGAGYAIFDKHRLIHSDHARLPDHASVFQAEVTAVKAACDAVLNSNWKLPRFVKCFIDSQAAILALIKGDMTSKTVRDAAASLNKLSKKVVSITLVWIPAHRGHAGNELVDRLAKKGAVTSNPTKCLSVPKSKGFLRQEIKNAALADWEKEWKTQDHAQHCRSFYASPNPQKAAYAYKLARLELGRLVRIVTGHNNLRFFQTKIGLWTNPDCRLCGDGPETITHLINECPPLAYSSLEIFKGRMPDATMKWSVRELLEFSYVPAVNEAFEGDWKDDRRTATQSGPTLSGSESSDTTINDG